MNMNTLPRIDTQAFNRALVGFDRMFDTFESRFSQQLTSNYPPHNVIKVDENNYIIEIAVAGFKKDEIKVEIEQEILSVTGSKDKSAEPDVQYVHRGLSSRDFVRQFMLGEYIVVNNAIIQDGILSVNLERVIPEEKKPRLIEITEIN